MLRLINKFYCRKKEVQKCITNKNILRRIVQSCKFSKLSYSKKKRWKVRKFENCWKMFIMNFNFTYNYIQSERIYLSRRKRISRVKQTFLSTKWRKSLNWNFSSLTSEIPSWFSLLYLISFCILLSIDLHHLRSPLRFPCKYCII